jgi:lipopolysaccharide export LptBFGC system permease protein LptF
MEVFCMKNTICKVMAIGAAVAAFVMTVIFFVKAKANHARKMLTENKAEGFVDTAVKILMAVVIGALVLAGLYLLFNSTILPTLTQRIQEMFNYRG